MKELSFGDPVTNICAGDINPRRHSYFVEHVKKSCKTVGGFPYTEHLAKCTDRKGKFWQTEIDVIYPGHLDYEECQRLFAPVWEAQYGDFTKREANTSANPSEE